MRRETRSKARAAGFSLVEILAVIVILSILMVVLLPRLQGMGETANVNLTQTWFAQLEGAISEYEDRFGDWPPSQHLEKWGTAPNTTNIGGEALVLSMWSPEWGGATLPEDKLVNTDGDETKKSLTKMPRASLFELADAWGNPVAYFHHRDYGRQDSYFTIDGDTSEEVEGAVKAHMNRTTGTWFHPQRYQLLSAGPDGRFGTEDDIGNFSEDAQ